IVIVPLSKSFPQRLKRNNWVANLKRIRVMFSTELSKQHKSQQISELRWLGKRRISIEELDQKAQQKIRQAGQNAYQKMENDYQIDTKTNYTDLVTTIDRENEQLINDQLRKIDPDGQILSEEGFGDKQIS